VVPFLETLENRNAEAILGALLERSAQGLTTDETVKRTGWPPSQVQEVAAKLVTAKHARQVANQPPTFANAQSVNECAATLIRTVEDFHRANPLLSGTTKQDLLGKTRDSGVAVFETALDDLVKARKVTVTGDVVQSAGRELTLTSDEAKAKTLIEREFENAGLAVPGFATILEKLPVDSKRAEKLLQILLREKVLVKVASDLIFHGSALSRLKEMLASYKKQRGDQLPINTFKELTGVSRKYAIPLLEHLDRERVTRRVGDLRVIM
jgi:selenocysteine-specific elongation factor